MSTASLPVAQVDAERLGHQVAANAERRLAGWIREPLRVQLLDGDGRVVAAIPAADVDAANSIAAELRTAGWNTRIGGTR